MGTGSEQHSQHPALRVPITHCPGSWIYFICPLYPKRVLEETNHHTHVALVTDGYELSNFYNSGDDPTHLSEEAEGEQDPGHTGEDEAVLQNGNGDEAAAIKVRSKMLKRTARSKKKEQSDRLLSSFPGTVHVSTADGTSAWRYLQQTVDDEQLGNRRNYTTNGDNTTTATSTTDHDELFEENSNASSSSPLNGSAKSAAEQKKRRKKERAGRARNILNLNEDDDDAQHPSLARVTNKDHGIGGRGIESNLKIDGETLLADQIAQPDAYRRQRSKCPLPAYGVEVLITTTLLCAHPLLQPPPTHELPIQCSEEDADFYP
ncbi:unnamed protein product [Amoebophrya sp. A25]|nr:unnamed protein product [Amoebophrya sp. A25]|eukprot:GSA25T00012118001.1